MNSGDLMLFGYWAQVIEPGQTKTLVQDVNTKEKFEIKGRPLIDAAFSADAYSVTEQVTRTKIAEKLVNSPNRPLTVKFKKQDGTERTIRGRFLSSEHILGRSYIEDMDLDKERTRLVDHRTISELIVDNVKYVAKK